MTLAVPRHIDHPGKLEDSRNGQLGTGCKHQRAVWPSERFLETAVAGAASEKADEAALPTARGAEFGSTRPTAASGPETCAARQCCQDNSCSSSLSQEQLSHPDSSSLDTHTAIDDDTGCPRTSLDSQGSHHLHRLSSRLSSSELGPQAGSRSAKSQAAPEPLLEDNDDRFCLFPIK